MFWKTTFLAIVTFTLFGCRTPQERLTVEGNELARCVGDFVLLRERMPNDVIELRDFAEDGDYRVVWSHIKFFSCHAVSIHGVKMEYADQRGVSDYRKILVNGKCLPPIGSSKDNLADYIEDPKTIVILSH